MPPTSHKSAYSVSYFPLNDEILFLHVSSMRNCVETNTEVFLNGIVAALTDMKELLESKKL